MARLHELFRYCQDNGASDLHLVAQLEPRVRRRGHLEAIPGWQVLGDAELRAILREVVSDEQWQEYERDGDLDFAYGLEGVARFRGNYFVQEMGASAVFRAIPQEIIPLETLNLPPAIDRLAELPRGLVLVTGPTGSGKSTTLAAIIDRINRTHRKHVVTIEDPVEFVHQNRECVFSQREVGTDTDGFSGALRGALREDADVILVGEMRDLETIRLALTAAETGHLVFGTLHTSSAAKTVDRIVDVFPAAEKEMVRAMLSESLVAVVSQSLCKLKDGSGRVAAHEIMLGTAAIRNLIRENKVAQMYSAIQTGNSLGMQTLDQNLADLVRRNVVSPAEARSKAKFPENFPG